MHVAPIVLMPDNDINRCSISWNRYLSGMCLPYNYASLRIFVVTVDIQFTLYHSGAQIITIH